MTRISISADFGTMSNSSNPKNFDVDSAKDSLKAEGMAYDGATRSWSGTVEQAREAIIRIDEDIDTLSYYVDVNRSTNRTEQCRSHMASLKSVRDMLSEAVEASNVAAEAEHAAETGAAETETAKTFTITAAPAGWNPCGYPGCNHVHCDECDGRGANVRWYGIAV